MRRLFLFLLPLPCLAWVANCTLTEDPQTGRAMLICYGNDTEEPDGPVMDQSECLRLREEVTQIILNAKSSVEEALYVYDNQIQVLNYNYYLALDNYDYIVASKPYWPDTNQYDVVEENAVNLKNNIEEARSSMVNERPDIVAAISDLDSAANAASSVSCPENQSCSGSGSGTVTCPCTDQWNQQLLRMSQLVSQAGVISTNCALLVSLSSAMLTNLQQVSIGMAAITNRLNSPDDRMWSELQDLYANVASNVQTYVAYTNVNLGQLWYNIRSLVRGEGTDSELGNLNLTTEGVLSLYQGIINTAQFSANQYQAELFHRTFYAITNSILTYYDQWRLLTGKTPGLFVPTSTKYQQIYRVMTNNALSAQNRYNIFSGGVGAGVTNWFQRMELYNQALLGWFENTDETDTEREQDRLTESQLRESMRNTTNDLSQVVAAAGSVSNALKTASALVVDAISDVEIRANLPTQIRLFPEVDLGAFGIFDAVYLDLEDAKPYCDVARNATSLVWRVSFWCIYIGVAIGIARLVLLLVLYVIHFVKDL